MPPASVFAVGFFELLSRLVDQPAPGLRPFPTEKLQLLLFQLVGRDEKLFDLGTDLLGQLARVGFGLLAMRMARDGNDAVIAYSVFATLGLHDLKNANDLALQDKTRRGRGVMQDQYVDGVAIFTPCRWNETQSCGYVSPRIKAFESVNNCKSGSNSSFAAEPRGVSTTTWKSPFLSRTGSL